LQVFVLLQHLHVLQSMHVAVAGHAEVGVSGITFCVYYFHLALGLLLLAVFEQLGSNGRIENGWLEHSRKNQVGCHCLWDSSDDLVFFCPGIVLTIALAIWILAPFLFALALILRSLFFLSLEFLFEFFDHVDLLSIGFTKGFLNLLFVPDIRQLINFAQD